MVYVACERTYNIVFNDCENGFRPVVKMSDRKAVIKNADMSEEMQQDAVDCATQALEKYNIEKVSRESTFFFFFSTLSFRSY